MGNYCDFEQPTLHPEALPVLTRSKNFIEDSWQLLKRHHQLAFITGPEENEITSYLLSLPRKRNELKILPIRAEQNIFIAYKYDSFFYLGQMGRDCIEGVGALALPGNRVFMGEFKKDRIEGKGTLVFPISASSSKAVRITGSWGEEMRGNLQIEINHQSFPFSVSKTGIKLQKSPMYIQYPNYDEYIGETENGLAHGWGKYIFRNGNANRQYPQYEGMFVCGLREGKGVLRFSESQELSIAWVQGRPNGAGSMLIGRTKLAVTYRNGQRIKQLPSQVD